MQASSFIQAGDFGIHIVNGRTKTEDEWAEEITDKIISVADSAPAPIRDQAHAFRRFVFQVIRDNIRLAVQHERQACAVVAEQTGSPDIASAIRARTY